MLSIKKAVCGYRRGNTLSVVISGLDMEVDHGQIMCVLGRNGAGKTTLFRSILGSLPLLGGEIAIDGSSLISMNRSQIARRIAYVPQSHVPPFPFTVRQIVEMGRASHMKIYSTPSEKDRMASEKALRRMGIMDLADRPYTEISGGERQLVLIARAIAQEADYLIMDEPSSSLDFGNQVRVMELIRGLAETGHGIIMTTHYPDQVFMADSYCTVIRDSEHFLGGRAEEVLTAGLMKELYGIEAEVLTSISSSGRTARSVAAYGTAGKEIMWNVQGGNE